jgi:hypothetical protein
MHTSSKLIGASALALVLAFGGCSNRGFEPTAGKDAAFALGVNLDKEQAFKIVDAYAKFMFDSSKFDENEARKIKEKIAAYKKDVFMDAPPRARAFIEKSGLRDATFRWAVVTMERLKFVDGKPQLGGLSVAIGGDVELKKFFSAIREESGEEATFEEVEIGGEKAWHVLPSDDADATLFKKANIDPYVTSLDGQLVLVAMSRDTLEKQIRLYRTGEGKGDALEDFSAADGELMQLHLSGIGDLVRQNVSRRDLRVINRGIANGDELVCGLRNLDVKTTVRRDGLLSDLLRLETASEKDADTLRTLAKTGLMASKAQMARESAVPPGLTKLIDDVTIGGADRQVEVKCGSFGVGVLAGALFPAISSAMLSANASVLALNGRKLYVGIIQANVERKAAGVGPVWPRTKAAAGADKKNTAARAYASAAEYFSVLFDMEHHGTSEWAPGMDGNLLSSLGKKGVVGKTISASGLDWCIAANVTDEMPDDTIVLVSANFNPALLLRKWDGQADGKKILPIGPKSGAPKSMLGDRAVVIVRKGGSAETIKKKFLTYDVLYRKRAFDITNVNPPLVYLTPVGVVEPVGHE